MVRRVVNDLTRPRIVEAIRKAQFATVSDLCQVVGRSHATVSYHLRALGAAGKVRAIAGSAKSRHVVYTLTEAEAGTVEVILPATAAAAVFGHALRRDIYHVALDDGEIGYSQLQIRLRSAHGRLPVATLSYHLRVLVQAGALVSARRGRMVIYRAA